MGSKKLEMRIEFEESSSKNPLLGELGKKSEEEEWKIGDILEAAAESLRERIESESILTIELSGQVRLENRADANVGKIFFTIAGGRTGEKTTATKITLETKIKPRRLNNAKNK